MNRNHKWQVGTVGTNNDVPMSITEDKGTCQFGCVHQKVVSAKQWFSPVWAVQVPMFGENRLWRLRNPVVHNLLSSPRGTAFLSPHMRRVDKQKLSMADWDGCRHHRRQKFHPASPVVAFLVEHLPPFQHGLYELHRVSPSNFIGKCWWEPLWIFQTQKFRIECPQASRCPNS